MRRKGDGWEVPDLKNKKTGKIEAGNVIYVLGTIDGIFYRRSTKKKVNSINIAWIKKNARDVLLKLIAKEEIHNKPIKLNDLESFGTMVLETTARGRRSANSQKCKLGNFKNHILPYFENYGLCDIKTTDVEVWQNKLLEKYSTSTVKKCRDILNLIFKKAQADDLVNKNYVEFADNVAVKSKKKVPYTKEELRLMVEHSTGWFKLYLTLVFSTGLRIGEAIGLQWEDIDLNNGFIDLKRSISKGVIVDATDETNKTKNHQRIIPLDNTLKKELANYFMDRPDDTWVFVNKYGNHFGDSKTLNVYYWKPLLAKLDIEDRTMYATRHTFVTLMKNNGADTAWLKSVIGHKQSSTVLDDVYFTHKSSAKDIKLANNFFHIISADSEKVC
jgi:integrase